MDHLNLQTQIWFNSLKNRIIFFFKKWSKKGILQ